LVIHPTYSKKSYSSSRGLGAIGIDLIFFVPISLIPPICISYFLLPRYAIAILIAIVIVLLFFLVIRSTYLTNPKHLNKTYSSSRLQPLKFLFVQIRQRRTIGASQESEEIHSYETLQTYSSDSIVIIQPPSWTVLF